VRRLLLAVWLLAGCTAGPVEVSLDPTPALPAGETTNYYHTALAHYRVQERPEAITFARLALQKWEQEKAPRRQVRLARELLARSLAESGDKPGALAEYQKLSDEFPGVPSYQQAVNDLRR